MTGFTRSSTPVWSPKLRLTAGFADLITPTDTRLFDAAAKAASPLGSEAINTIGSGLPLLFSI
jgi:hypothetical protein